MDEEKRRQEELDEQLISAAAQKLFDTYMSSNHRGNIDIIKRAFNFAKQAHKGVRRLSGEPYILHPIAVAQIACEEIGLGSTSISAALLHDVVEDTEYTHEDLENLFGVKVANIVEGVTKISGGIFGEQASQQAETFKKMLLSMSDDIRVVLIKISDRLHNMRTLSSMRPSKQYKIAAETMYIFAPLADRLGLNRIKNELQDLSFRYEHPEIYAEIVQKLEETSSARTDLLEVFVPPIRKELDAMGVKYDIKARVKSPYSIWQKMQRKKIKFEEVFDIFAVRIIFTPQNREREIQECYSIEGALTTIYPPHPDRRRVWLAQPKANGYQALHNTFMSPLGQWVEVQIRSDRMDDIAEGGIAAHWKYKDPDTLNDTTELDRWLNSIKEILDDPQPNTLDMLDSIKLNLLVSEIMVLTPKGEVRHMPQGSTVLDFAFNIHSFVGTHCIGAKVNHELVPLSYKLKGGDQVEILTSNTQKVQPEWLDYVTTGKAKSKIEAILRRENRERQKKGEEIVKKFLEEHNWEPTIVSYDRLVLYHRQPSRKDFFMTVADGREKLDENDILFLRGKRKVGAKGWRRFIPFLSSKIEDVDTVSAASVTEFISKINRKKTLQLTDDILDFCKIAGCCSPIPGDDVLGYISPDGNRLEIHMRNCHTANKLKTRDGNNIIACSWATNRRRHYPATIYIKGVDGHGVLHAIADVFESLDFAVVKSIALSTEDGIFDGNVLVDVYDTTDVEKICRKLKSLESVQAAYRVGK